MIREEMDGDLICQPLPRVAVSYDGPHLHPVEVHCHPYGLVTYLVGRCLLPDGQETG